MKKMLGIVFILLVGLYLTACGNDKKESLVENDLLSLSVIGGVNDINFNQMSKFSLDGLVDKEEVVEDDQGDKTEIDNIDHLELMLNLMNDKTYSNEVVKSDDENYENLLLIKVGKEEFKFYFNEKVIKHEIDDEDINEYEEEKVTEISGVIINNDITYTVSGEKSYEFESETDDEKIEIEDELELELKISLDENTYSIIKYEVENEQEEDSQEIEKSLVFKTYVNKKKVNEMKIDFELENNELEIELEIKEEGKIFKYELKNKNNNEITIKYQIKTSENTIKGQINVKIVTDQEGNVSYEY